MIFYFSGTGNSKYIAQKLLSEGEQLVNLAEALQKRQYEFEISENEAVGLVFPVYFYTLPTIVREFINKMQLVNASYIYAAITCGGGIGQSGAVLKKELSAKGLVLNYCKEVLMPDNSMLFYQIPGVQGADERIMAADVICQEMKQDILERKQQKIGNNTMISSIMEIGYKACSKTKKFHALDACISCGKCAENCPESAIVMENGKPKWVKDECCKCSSCINRCPVAAIQYGEGTKKRNRYVNPREKA